MKVSFDDYSRVVTKYVLDDPGKFQELVNKMQACEHAGSKAAAGALGYLMAMEEKEKEKRCIYDEVLEQVEKDHGDPAIRTDAIMTEVYCWLDKAFEREGYEENAVERAFLLELFTPYIVSSNLDRT